MNNKKSNLIYIPNSKIGTETFSEPLCPTKDVYKVIGAQGLEDLKNALSRVLKNRIEILGIDINNSGFYNHQAFILKKEAYQINLSVEKALSEKHFKQDAEFYEFPELLKKPHIYMRLDWRESTSNVLKENPNWFKELIQGRLSGNYFEK